MGYIKPDREPEPRDFADQFEWDGHGWLFRRFHRERPVRVTADEMAQCIDSYERWNNRLAKAGIVATIVGIVIWIYLDSKGVEWASGRPEGLAAASLAALGWLGRRWAWLKATERFTRRVPVGIGQSWLEERQSLATEQDYLELVGLLLFVGIGAYLMWSIDQARWFEIAMAAIAGFAALLNLALKLRARFL